MGDIAVLAHTFVRATRKNQCVGSPGWDRVLCYPDLPSEEPNAHVQSHPSSGSLVEIYMMGHNAQIDGHAPRVHLVPRPALKRLLFAFILPISLPTPNIGCQRPRHPARRYKYCVYGPVKGLIYRRGLGPEFGATRSLGCARST